MDESDLEQRLGLLRIEHRDLDDAIAALGMAAQVDQLQIARNQYLSRPQPRLLVRRDEPAVAYRHPIIAKPAHPPLNLPNG